MQVVSDSDHQVMQVEDGMKNGWDSSEAMQVVSDSDHQVMQVEGGVKDGQDSSG